MSTYTPNTFLPGKSEQREGGVGSHGRLVSGWGRPAGFSGLPKRSPTGPRLTPSASNSHASCLYPGLSEGPVPGGGKEATSGKEPEEPSPQKLLKAYTIYTHSDTPLPWKPSQSPKPSSGKSGSTLLDQVASRRKPGLGEGGPLSGPPRASFPGRLPSKGAPQRRDWWSRRRNKS